MSVTDTETENSKLIKTKYTTIAYGNDRSLVEVELETGRTHQIRAQMAHISHPLAGDRKYGAKSGGTMKLASYKLRFAFTSDADILNYMNGREFQITVDFAETFSQANS